MNQEKLAAILSQGDAEACVTFFAKLSEKERKGYIEEVRTWFKSISKKSFVEVKPGTFGPNPLLDAAQVAMYSVCPFSDLKAAGSRALPEHELLMEILNTRRPDWLDDWAEWLCEVQPAWWSLVRRLIRQGLCRAPQTDHYFLGMIVSLCPYYDPKTTIYDALLEDPELLEKDVWRLFEVEGDKDLTLAARDKYSRGDNHWTYALVRLAQENRLSRAGRLLDASLDALQRDFSQAHAGWFSQFHEALAPTPKERQQRSVGYLALLSSKIPPNVSFALKALQILAASDMVDAISLVDALKPALWSRHKGTVKMALQMLGQAAQKHFEMKPQIAMVVAEAFVHESPDVQKLAIDLLEKHLGPVSPALAALLSERLANVAASQRARLQKLVGAASSASNATSEKTPATALADIAQETSLRQRVSALPKKWRMLAGVDKIVAAMDENRGDFTALDFDPMAVPHLDPAKRITPIGDLDELIDAFAHVLEEPDDPIKVERVFDGVSRMCDQRPDDFAVRTAPLRKRAMDRLARMFVGPFIGCGVLADLCGVARAWLTGEVILPVVEHRQRYDKTLIDYCYDNSKKRVSFLLYFGTTPRTFLARRALALAQRCAKGESAILLAMPTHEISWIDPRELVKRSKLLNSTEQDGDAMDQIQALLRLAPEHRKLALKDAKSVNGEYGQALRYALDGDEKIGANSALWIAAARARTPFADDEKLSKKHANLGPDAGQAARYEAAVDPKTTRLRIHVEPAPKSKLSAEMVTVVLNPQSSDEGEHENMETREQVADLRGIMTIWPIQRESWFARGAFRIANNLDWWEAEWANRTLLEPLLDPDVPLKPMALLMLALGLAAKEPGESGLATDALIAAIDDGRLQGSELGGTFALLAPMKKHARWARTLGQAVRMSSLHLHVVVRIIQAALRGDPTKPPRDVQTMLELLKEGLTELGEGISDKNARTYLEQIKAGGKTARLTRELLALDEQPQPLIRRQVLLRALEQRIARADSWCRMQE